MSITLSLSPDSTKSASTPDSEKLSFHSGLSVFQMVFDVFFWLGMESTQDEQGTAAYKTVELDDLLDGAAVQYREVMMHESKEFKAIFRQINYLKGGVDSGFTHVESAHFAAPTPRRAAPRLLG